MYDCAFTESVTDGCPDKPATAIWKIKISMRIFFGTDTCPELIKLPKLVKVLIHIKHRSS